MKNIVNNDAAKIEHLLDEKKWPPSSTRFHFRSYPSVRPFHKKTQFFMAEYTLFPIELET
jgi:hypothetical protein